ncbi:hypothetical protein CGCF413_v000186 [Colletotrichum fructicola]|nr:hypothetical protein CGCF413_v000186 [Colletotrichum fructicola]
MANLLLRARNGKPVGKRWARRFVDSQPALKTKFSPYDYQRALQEDPEVISKWFALLRNMMAKYGIQEGDLYNFDETGFMMGMITASMVVTRADRRGKAKSVQPGNREWATVIECINSGGWCIPPFVIVKGVYHLASWTTESGFPGNWVIKPTANGWTDNQTGLDWIKHFDKHTKNRTKGVYRMLIIDGHESHLSAEFDDYCKQNNIITVVEQLSKAGAIKADFTSKKLKARAASIEIHSLPSTIRDAIHAARKLDLQYLWVDRLCIIQDSAEDWAHEAALMCQVYSGATLTLSADGSNSATQGLFQTDQALSKLDYRTYTDPDGDATPMVLIKPQPHPTVSGRALDLSQPIDSRGWTMQERLMSRRVLHFTSDEMAWECDTLTEYLDIARWSSYLVLVESLEEKGKYERIGCFDVWGREDTEVLRSLFAKSEAGQITII